MRRVSETNICLRNHNCTTALLTFRCYLEATDDFPIFLSSRRLFLKISTEIKRGDIIQSLMTRIIVIFQETSSMNVDYFRYLVLAGNFLNFRLCEIQLGAQCLLGEHGPLKELQQCQTFFFLLNEQTTSRLFRQERHLHSSTSTTTNTRFDFKFLAMH